MSDLKYVAYCGIYCGLCSRNNRIPKQASDLLNTLKKEAIEQWGPSEPSYKGFWSFLKNLTVMQSSCRGGCGVPTCAIRKCVLKKGIDACPLCDEYPCNKLSDGPTTYVTLKRDNERMREIGIDKWIDEQEKRKATGFIYKDVNYYVPFKLKSDYKNQTFIIESDLPEVGWRLYVYHKTKCIADYLLETLENAKKQAFKDYSVPMNSWTEMPSNENNME